MIMSRSTPAYQGAGQPPIRASWFDHWNRWMSGPAPDYQVAPSRCHGKYCPGQDGYGGRPVVVLPPRSQVAEPQPMATEPPLPPSAGLQSTTAAVPVAIVLPHPT
jgi:hypothetical protein